MLYSYKAFNRAMLILLVVSTGFASSKASVNSVIVLGNRSLGKDPNHLCRLLVEVRGSCEVASDTTKEFGDGSTFVQIQEVVYGSHVVVAVPSLSLQATEPRQADYFLESLLKIRTARDLGATVVEALIDERTSDFERLLLKAAGASNFLIRVDNEFIIDEKLDDGADTRNKANAINGVRRMSSPAAETLNNSVVYSTYETDFTRGLSKALKVSYESDVLKVRQRLLMEPSSVVLYVGQWSVHAGNSGLLNDLKAIYDLVKSVHVLRDSTPHIMYVSPYLPYSRGDKVDHPGTAVSGRLIADMIGAVHPALVLFSRLHAPQSQGFFSVPSLHVQGRATITAELQKLGLDAIVSPDAGFQKEASRYAADLNLPVIVLNKYRDPTTGESHLQTIGAIELQGKRVAIIDDETASGGTLGNAAKFLKTMGANEVYAVVTHLTGNAEKAIQDANIDHIYVTNTLEVKTDIVKERVTVLDITAEFASIIFQTLTHKPNCEEVVRGAL